MLTLLAQAEAGGVNGWVAAAGTVSLLGPVLYWLCYVHLPAKDEQLVKVIAVKDLQISKLIDEFRAESKEARADCAANLKIERELRHAERNRASEDMLKVALALERNTAETAKLAQENRAFAAVVANQTNKAAPA